MTKLLHRIRAALRDRLLERGVPLQRPLNPVARDGYSVLWQWGEAGEPIRRMTPEMVMQAREWGLPLDLPLAHAPTRAYALAYQLVDRGEWIVVGRIPAGKQVIVSEPHAIGYSEPMLLYLTESDGTWRAGCYNLQHSPTPRQLRITPGRHFAELWTTVLDRSALETELLRLAQVLPHYYIQ